MAAMALLFINTRIGITANVIVDFMVTSLCERVEI